MKISPHTLPNATVARQTLPEAADTAPRNERAEAAKAAPALRANPPGFSTLSSETNWNLVQATQHEPRPSEHAGKSPAQGARALIAERPDLAALPFGKVVSMLARGLTPPAAPASVDEETGLAPETTEGVGDPEAPPTVPPAEAVADGATEAALSLLEPLNVEADDETTPDLVGLAAQAGLTAPPETDPADLLDPA